MTVRFSDRTGARVAFEDRGSGPCLVFTHSVLCDRTLWEHQASRLSQSCRVLNVDLRGHGESPPSERPFTLYDLVDDVVGVLDTAEVEAAVWVGLSIGGMLSLRAALTYPERVSGLVIVDSDAGRERIAKRLRYGAMSLGARLVGTRPFADPVAKLMFGDATRRDRPETVDRWKQRLARADVRAMAAIVRAVTSRDSVTATLGEVRAPCLVLVGAEDQALPTRHSQRIAELVPDAELTVIPEAGHLCSLERPREVTAALEAFVSRLPHA